LGFHFVRRELFAGGWEMDIVAILLCGKRETRKGKEIPGKARFRFLAERMF